jgi:hypothetical protein
MLHTLAPIVRQRRRTADGHRLSRATRQGAFEGLSAQGIIVPTRALQAVSRTAEEATSPVEIEADAYMTADPPP